MKIYESLELPVAARIDKVVAKKQFYDNGGLSPADKKLFEHVEKIHWRYALKTENTFIQSYKDEVHDYSEIEVLEVNLREDKQLNRLTEIIIRAIPYPMLVFFQWKNRVRLCMGKLRQNQNDSMRMTITGMESTEWMAEEDAFWKALSIRKMPGANFRFLYEAWFDAISKSHLAAFDLDAAELSGDDARERVRRLNAIEQEMTKLHNQMKKESQFNRKMEINTRLQKLKREKNELMK